MKILNNARIPCRLLTDKISILETYANDFTAKRLSAAGRTPYIAVGEKSMWSDIVKQIMPSMIEEKSDCVIRNNGEEFISCIVVGQPDSGVSGYPSDLSPAFLNQLFELSMEASGIIKLDLTIKPIDPAFSVREVKTVMKRIDANVENAKSSQMLPTLQDLQLDRDDYEVLLARLKNGEDKLHHVSFVISVFAPSRDVLTASMSRIKAIMNAYQVRGDIPHGKMLETLKSTRLLPYIDINTTVELPTTALSKITPLISNSNNIMANDGTWFGNDGDEEIIINQDDLAAGHMAVFGPTGSGKTTAILALMVKDVTYQNRKVIYITPKPDAGTNYRAVAEYFKDTSQIYRLGT